MGGINIAVLLVSSIILCSEAADLAPSSQEKKVICYFTNWSYKRAQPYDFTADKIDPFVCTHIIYAFADIGSRNNLVSSDPAYDFDKNAFATITGLKKKNKNLKVMISVGGWNAGTIGFGVVTSNETNRKEFAKNAVRFIRGYKFDGLDLNWQHPTFREGGTPEDKANYVLLAQALREEFDREAAANNKTPLLLSIAISHNMNFLPAYDVSSFNNYMDFISVICYDYHFSYETNLNHHSPLYSVENSESNVDNNINTNFTIHYFMELADPEKLILGIPTYGRTYRLEKLEDTALGSPADGAGDGGPVLHEKGFLAYFEICDAIKNDNWTVVQTKVGSAGPYAYKGHQWVCFDDLDMIRTKAAYAKQKGLGGVMFWTIDYDDFMGKCQDDKFSKFPIIRAARDELNPSNEMIFVDDNDSTRDARPQQSPWTVSPRPVQPVVPMRDNQGVNSFSNYQKPSGGQQEQISRRPYLPSLPRTTPNQSPVNRSVEERNIVTDLVRLLERAGGLKNFCKILRQHNQSKSNLYHQKGYTMPDDSENSIVFETGRMPPVLVVVKDSSIYIKEVNIYQDS